MYDVIILGGGIVGCAVARALSRYQLQTLLIDRESDIACGATKANSGIVHAGYDCLPGTLKAALNVKGTALYPALAKELDFPYRNNGSLVLCFDEKDESHLKTLYEQGIQNGVPDISLLSREEVLALEPNLNPNVKAALLAKTAGVVSPYEAAIAFAENAAENGVVFCLGVAVNDISVSQDGFIVKTETDLLESKVVINAAGAFSGVFHGLMAHPEKEPEVLQYQRGQYFLLDNTQGHYVSHTLFQLPTALGKGVLVAPTADYNLLLGPTAEAVDDGFDTLTTREGLNEVLAKAALTLAQVPAYDRITAFAGVRAKHPSQDFCISEPVKGFISAVGIDSPGLTAAPAIAEMIAQMTQEHLNPALKPDFLPTRKGIKRFKHLSFSEQEQLIRENPQYGHVVCRCETITEAEIVDAIHRPLGARTLDALKRRARAQMGRCQGGFCTLRLIELLSRELGLDETEITKHNKGSNIFSS